MKKYTNTLIITLFSLVLAGCSSKAPRSDVSPCQYYGYLAGMGRLNDADTMLKSLQDRKLAGTPVCEVQIKEGADQAVREKYGNSGGVSWGNVVLSSLTGAAIGFSEGVRAENAAYYRQTATQSQYDLEEARILAEQNLIESRKINDQLNQMRTQYQ